MQITKLKSTSATKIQPTIVQKDCITFLKSLPSNHIDVIITDPAYSGMNRKLNFGSGRIVGKYKKENNAKWFEEFQDTEENYGELLRECHRVMKEESHIYIMFDSYSLLSLGNIVRKFFNVKNVIVWDKVNLGMGHNFRRRHEFIIFATKGNKKINSRSIPDVWTFKRIARAKYPTQKPTELFEMMLMASAHPGAYVCDPFVGSGSSAIAAIKNNCKFFGADISSTACALTRKRADVFLKTGQDPLQPKSTLISRSEK